MYTYNGTIYNKVKRQYFLRGQIRVHVIQESASSALEFYCRLCQVCTHDTQESASSAQVFYCGPFIIIFTSCEFPTMTQSI